MKLKMKIKSEKQLELLILFDQKRRCRSGREWMEVRMKIEFEEMVLKELLMKVLLSEIKKMKKKGEVEGSNLKVVLIGCWKEERCGNWQCLG